jgi:hypothetical protein
VIAVEVYRLASVTPTTVLAEDTVSGKTLEMAVRMLDEARDDVIHADQKSSLLLAALGVGFGAVVGGQLQSGWDSSVLTVCGQVFWWIGVASAVAAVGMAAWAIWPRYKLDDSPKYGITYWGHVAALTGPEELTTTLKKQEVTSLDRTSHQLYILSRLVLKKYRRVRAALVLAGAAGVLMGAATVFFS